MNSVKNLFKKLFKQVDEILTPEQKINTAVFISDAAHSIFRNIDDELTKANDLLIASIQEERARLAVVEQNLDQAETRITQNNALKARLAEFTGQ